MYIYRERDIKIGRESRSERRRERAWGVADAAGGGGGRNMLPILGGVLSPREGVEMNSFITLYWVEVDCSRGRNHRDRS